MTRYLMISRLTERPSSMTRCHPTQNHWQTLVSSPKLWNHWLFALSVITVVTNGSINQRRWLKYVKNDKHSSIILNNKLSVRLGAQMFAVNVVISHLTDVVDSFVTWLPIQMCSSCGSYNSLLIDPYVILNKSTGRHLIDIISRSTCYWTELMSIGYFGI